MATVKTSYPWFHADYEPSDPTVRAFAVRALEASGGVGGIGRQSRRRDSLVDWFRTTIPDLLGSPTDLAAIDCQAHYLSSCEGSDSAVTHWSKAVVAQFHLDPLWPTCFEQDLGPSSSWGYAPSHIAVRGMQLYSVALTRLATSMDITSIRVYRGLVDAPGRWQPNALASVGWSAKHSMSSGRVVRFADVDPSVIVGITMVYECHPIIAPFSITAGPGRFPVEFHETDSA